jgi:hypothetical protein
MLTIEIRVNGSLISAANVHNKGYASGTDDTCEYTWDAVRFPLEIGTLPVVSTGKLQHKRSEGAEALVSKLMKLIGNVEKKTPTTRG